MMDLEVLHRMLSVLYFDIDVAIHIYIQADLDSLVTTNPKHLLSPDRAVTHVIRKTRSKADN